MDKAPDELIARLITPLDHASLGPLARVCKRLCTQCRQVYATHLRLEGDDGKQLFLMPPTRGFPACSCLQYELSGSNRSHSSAVLLALAHAALHMPALHTLKINMLEEARAEHVNTARQELCCILSACRQLRALRDLAVAFEGELTATQVAAATPLTGLTALQLSSSGYMAMLHPQLTQLAQLQQLRLAGVYAAEGAAACLPSNLTGLTFTLRLGDQHADAGWAQQLQQCNSLCSLEVLLWPSEGNSQEAESCGLLQKLACLPPGAQQQGSEAAGQAVVLPSLTQLVFKPDHRVTEGGYISFPDIDDDNWPAAMPLLFPSLQSLQVQQPRGEAYPYAPDDAVLHALVGCSQQLKDLGWLGEWEGTTLATLPGLSFPQLTSLRMDDSWFIAGDFHVLCPALQDLSLGFIVEGCMGDAVPALLMCTGLTRLAMRLQATGGITTHTAAVAADFCGRLAAGLPSLCRLYMLFDEERVHARKYATWTPQVVSAVGALTQLTHLHLGCKPFRMPVGLTSQEQKQRRDALAALQHDRAQNLQLALAQQLLKLLQLQELVLSDMAGVSAAVVAGVLAHTPSLQLLQLEGCSEGLDIAQQQWAAAEGAVAARLQQLRAGLREGVVLAVTHSSWDEEAPSYW